MTALLVAGKYEEIEPPTLLDIVQLTDPSYSMVDVKAMEIKILKAAKYSLGWPVPLHFLRRLSTTGRVRCSFLNFTDLMVVSSEFISAFLLSGHCRDPYNG